MPYTLQGFFGFIKRKMVELVTGRRVRYDEENIEGFEEKEQQVILLGEV